MDIPEASDFERTQKSIIAEELEKNKSKKNFMVNLSTKPEQEIIEELEQKGYLVTYNTSYRLGQYNTLLNIENPKIKDAGRVFDDTFGFSNFQADDITRLINMFTSYK